MTMNAIESSETLPTPGPGLSHAPMGPLTLSYVDAGAAGPAVVGGKGANLGRLARYGFDVPAGGVLTAAAYRAHLAGAGVDEILSTLTTVPADQADDPVNVALLDAVRRALATTPLPAAVADAAR